MWCGPELRVGYRVAQCTQRTQCSHCELSVGLQCPAVLRARAVGPEDRPDLLGRARAPRQLRVVRSNAQDKPCSAVQCSAAQRSAAQWGGVGCGAVGRSEGKGWQTVPPSNSDYAYTAHLPAPEYYRVRPSTTEHEGAPSWSRTERADDSRLSVKMCCANSLRH